MVREPCRIRRKYFGLVGDLSAGRLVAGAQQGVVHAGPPPFRRPDPEAFPLERIARQRNPAPRLAREQPLEANRQTGPIASRHGSGKGVLGFLDRYLRGRPLEACNDRRRPGRSGGLGPGQGHHRTHHRVGTDLHHGLHAEFRQRRHGCSECHRLAHLAAPVRTVKHILRRYLATRHRADVGERRWRDRDVGERFLQIVQHRFDQRTVVGGALSQAPHLDILLLQAREQCVDLRGRSAHHLVGAIVGRDAVAGTVGVGVVLRYRCRHDGFGRKYSRHGAFAGQRRHQAPARGCKAQARLQAEDLRRLRRRQFPETVSDHDVGANAQT